MRYRILLGILVLACGGCATGYHSTGMTGGFEETRLNDRTVQVRFQGNGYTTQNRTQSFLLRRCAELTLESGRRWFSLGSEGKGATTAGSSGFIFSFPNGTATVKMLDASSEDPNPLDAALIVRETDKRAGGRLSPKARETLRGIENEK